LDARVLADLHVAAGAAISDVSDNRFGDPHHNLMAIILAACFATPWMKAMHPG
jgi:hypothetical protein